MAASRIPQNEANSEPERIRCRLGEAAYVRKLQNEANSEAMAGGPAPLETEAAGGTPAPR